MPYYLPAKWKTHLVSLSEGNQWRYGCSGGLWIALAGCLEYMVWGAEMGRADEIPVKSTCCFPKNVWEPGLCPGAVSLCWSGGRRHQSLLSSVTQASLWFSASRWELRKTHEFQTAGEVLQISRKGGEDKRKGGQTAKDSKGQCIQKGGKKRCVSFLFILVALPPGWCAHAL